ncbi:MAG TPA: L-threonylcarbamoyladenylate synthase [Quisquiliibacterium sp.]|nr:MAG: threonylcarbamoyl-AMP synthase [Burkholderiaceae bacterium]HOA93482.1 L-threonylcarbamoyladenylate synthase [Quisquiliibacterium sp.]HPA89392.1 L-threonylcarbamoyladenylate synthase [Quisquiliibacterium sp.]HQD83130.1 L-threonylcarbamoyladenylate synthase [Quisquiliibacterium sp.]HQN12468.1 L-threonylcarbamoyladenylate synthase [Quisquiliibacterium sp.]
MTQRFTVHPTHPQSRLLRQAAQILRDGGLVAMPTDACYVVACHLDDKTAVERLRALRGLDDKHLLTLMCRDLSELGVYAQVDNRQYRFLRDWTPGPYTFVLNATREVPRRLWHPSRKTIGLRVPSSPVAAGLLEAHGAPLLGSSLILPGETDPLHDPDDILERLARRLDAVVDAGGQGMQSTTVVDLTGDEPLVTRLGCGPVEGRIAVGLDED